MAITLKQAFALNGTPDLTSFKDLQEQCKNTDYFTDSNPINKLSSWEGYWYGTGDYKISLSASTTSVAASGGSVTITYTIKQVTSTGDTALSGVKPTITSSLGTAGTPTATNASGQGTCTITLSSLGCTVKSETTITVTGSFNGASSSTTFKQAANNKTTVAWNNPTISTFSYDNIAAGSTSATPSISYSQTGTQSYTSGTCTTTVTQNSEATISYSETTAHSAATVNSSTGVVTWTSNAQNTSSRSVGITVTVTLNGKSSTKTATSTQNADSIKTYGDVTISSFSYSNVGPSASNMTVNPSISASQTITYVSGATRTGTISYNYSESTTSSYAAVNATSGVITWNANSKVTSDRTVGITVTATGEGSKTATKTATSKCLKDYITSSSITSWYNNMSEVVEIASGGGTINSPIYGNISKTYKTGATETDVDVALDLQYFNINSNGNEDLISWESDYITVYGGDISRAFNITITHPTLSGEATCLVKLQGYSTGFMSFEVYNNQELSTSPNDWTLEINMDGTTYGSMPGAVYKDGSYYTVYITYDVGYNLYYADYITNATVNISCGNRSWSGSLSSSEINSFRNGSDINKSL